MESRLAYLWYEFCSQATMAGFTLASSLRTVGAENVPARGPALLVANHQSFLDPVLVGLAARRHLCYLARKTLFRHWLFRLLIESLGAVPIDQEGIGKEGIRIVLDQLKQGRAVLVFPEGERTMTGAMQPLKPGIQLLIKRTAVPIVPVGIAGAYQALPRWRHTLHLAPLFLPASDAAIAVAVGKPLDGRRFASLPREEVLTELFGEIKKMHDQAERLRRKSKV